MEGIMTSRVADSETSNKPISEHASSYRHITGALIDKLECGILFLKNVSIMHNGGRHSILVRDLSMDRALGALIRAAVDKCNRLKDTEITISRDDIPKKERFNYSYIVVVEQENVKAELP